MIDTFKPLKNDLTNEIDDKNYQLSWLENDLRLNAEHSFSETHKLMIGSIVPRPIALVSTTSKDGINNLAPFVSYFNDPHAQNRLLLCLLQHVEDGMVRKRIL